MAYRRIRTRKPRAKRSRVKIAVGYCKHCRKKTKWAVAGKGKHCMSCGCC